MKRQIIELIYDRFDNWSSQFGFACNRGCAACCITDVNISAPEGELLLDHITGAHGPGWLADKLAAGEPLHRELAQTTNDYARACLEGWDSEDEDRRRGGVCPVLHNDICSVYPARPFSCRCFASTICCRRGGNAVLPPAYLTAATAVSQIIEHVGQFSLWGTMIDVLTLQAAAAGHISRTGRLKNHLAAAHGNCLTAKPLPGFLIEDRVADQVWQLLEEIFTSPIIARRLDKSQVTDVTSCL